MNLKIVRLWLKVSICKVFWKCIHIILCGLLYPVLAVFYVFYAVSPYYFGGVVVDIFHWLDCIYIRKVLNR